MGATPGSPRAVVRINYDAARIMPEDARGRVLSLYFFFRRIQEKGTVSDDVYFAARASEASDFITEMKPSCET